MELRESNSILTLLLLLLLSLGCTAYADVAGQSHPADGHQVRVIDQNGKPLAGYAVIAASGLTRAQDAHDTDMPADGPVQVMDQRNEQFVPDLLIVPRGGRVEFPNSDHVMHHVYSFSDAKIFETPLYQGRLPSPVVFDKPGLVVLGCNIHDQMIGHILVVDTSQYGVTDAEGLVKFAEPPAEVAVWRPGLGAPADKFWPLQQGQLTEITIQTGSQAADTALSWSDY